MSLTITRFSTVRLLLAIFVAAAGLCAFASASQAACAYPNATQVFSPWSDSAYYQLAPDGGLEQGGTGWTLEGGATLVDGNEDSYLNGDEDKVALDLPYRAVAISPPVCVDDTTPQFRLMALNSGNKDAKLRVSVIYESVRLERKDTDIRAMSAWAPSEPLKLETRDHAERVARISFSAKDSKGDWQIDDLYIDPFARR